MEIVNTDSNLGRPGSEDSVVASLPATKPPTSKPPGNKEMFSIHGEQVSGREALSAYTGSQPMVCYEPDRLACLRACTLTHSPPHTPRTHTHAHTPTPPHTPTHRRPSDRQSGN